METETDTPEELIKALDHAMPDRRWLSVLQILQHTGVADTRQIQDASRLTRDKTMRSLEHLTIHRLNGFPLISLIDRTIKRPGEIKRPASVYRLEEGGARLLRKIGIEDAHVCELKENVQILHSLSMLSVHLEATKAKTFGIVTDHNLSFGDDRHIRPDHLVELTEDFRYLIEVEQEATTKLLPRIIESLSHRQEFFRSEAGSEFSNIVRMLVNVKPGSQFTKTIKVWREAMRQVVQKSELELGFSIQALPLQIFLSSPEWSEELSDRWALLVAESENSSLEEEVRGTPTFLRSNRSLEQDALLLRALTQEYFHKTAEAVYKLDWGMIAVVGVIYEASHGKAHRTYREVAGMPMASIHLLREYLNFHPALLTRLRQTMHYNRSRMVWTQQNILHRMRLVIYSFLSYHGWRSSDLIKIYPTIDGDGRGQYIVKVEVLTDPKLQMHSFQIENALSWVLLALFDYAADIGIGRPDFW